MPLDEVRKKLRVGPPPVYQPLRTAELRVIRAQEAVAAA